jgi:uncharacterized membrane protein YhaH (DUF805 family)
MDWKSLFFSAEGRIGRQAFWIGWLVLLGVQMLAGWIPVIGHALGLVALFAWVCLCTKRLHDMGYSGWWQAPALALGPVLLLGSVMWIAFGAAAAALGGGDPEVAALAGVGFLLVGLVVALLATIAFTLWVGISEGQAGENRFGATPLTPVMV